MLSQNQFLVGYDFILVYRKAVKLRKNIHLCQKQTDINK